MRLPGRWPYALPVVTCLVAVAAFLHTSGRVDSFPLDDAWIHQVYARALASGHGFEYNPGAQEAGATSPLWVIVTAPVHWVDGGNPSVVVAGVKLIGVLLVIASLLLFAGVARRLTGSALTACIAASLLALEPRLYFSALSGMETMLVVTLWLGVVYALMARRGWLATAALALMPLARPECLILLPVGAAALFFSNPDQSWRKKALWLVALGAPFALWALFCHRVSGHWLPNTYYVKSHGFHLSGVIIATTWHMVRGQGIAAVFLSPVGILVAIVELYRRRHWTALFMIVVTPLAYMVAVAATRVLIDDGYYWTRWLDPPVFMLAAAFALGVAILLTGTVTGIPARRPWRTVVIAAGIIVLAACALPLARSFGERRERLRTDAGAIDKVDIRGGRWIQNNTPGDATIGLTDTGALRYFGNRHSVDLFGINNRAVAFEEISQQDAMLTCEWLAIFPMDFATQQDFILSRFDLKQVIEITPAEYTICHCAGQRTLAIFHRKDAP